MRKTCLEKSSFFFILKKWLKINKLTGKVLKHSKSLFVVCKFAYCFYAILVCKVELNTFEYKFMYFIFSFKSDSQEIYFKCSIERIKQKLPHQLIFVLHIVNTNSVLERSLTQDLSFYPVVQEQLHLYQTKIFTETLP